MNSKASVVEEKVTKPMSGRIILEVEKVDIHNLERLGEVRIYYSLKEMEQRKPLPISPSIPIWLSERGSYVMVTMTNRKEIPGIGCYFRFVPFKFN